MSIPFNKSPYVDTAPAYIDQALRGKVSGDGPFTKKCSEWLGEASGCPRVLLTTSCSHALDMAARLCDLSPGDEVILPSYTFSSTANAFVGAGATLVFVDIRPDTMNLDETLIEDAITDRTRVIVPVHYAGVACEMDEIQAIAKRHGLKIVEDTAQGLMSAYKGRPLGCFSEFGSYSFHETKNFSMGEGGALLLGRAEDLVPAEMMREKGTDRSRFFRGEVDKYSWRTWGSSYLPSDINAAYLWSQLEMAEDITADRMRTWALYQEALAPLRAEGLLELPCIPGHCDHNAHMFYIKLKDLAQRVALADHLRTLDILAVSHYVPLHSAPAGLQYGRFHGEDRYTTRESDRLLRLPLYYGLTGDEALRVAEAVTSFLR